MPKVASKPRAIAPGSSKKKKSDVFQCKECKSTAQIPSHRMFARFEHGHAQQNNLANQASKEVGNVCWPCLERSELYKSDISKSWVLYSALRIALDPHANYYYRNNTYQFAVPREYGDNFLIHVSWLEESRKERLEKISRALKMYDHDHLCEQAEAMVKVFAEVNFEGYGWISDRGLRFQLREALKEPLVPYSREMLHQEPSRLVKLFNRVLHCSSSKHNGVKAVVDLEAVLCTRKEMAIGTLRIKFQEHLMEICRLFFTSEEDPHDNGFSKEWIARKYKDLKLPEYEEPEDESDEDDDNSYDSDGRLAEFTNKLKESPEYPSTVFDKYMQYVILRITDL